jgi:hypothetical protein
MAGNLTRHVAQKIYECRSADDTCSLIGRRTVIETGNGRGRLLNMTKVVRAGKNRWHYNLPRLGW